VWDGLVLESGKAPVRACSASRTIVDRSQLPAAAPKDAENAAVLRIRHADEKLRFDATMTAADDFSLRIN
jgi:hypothetical protein